MSYVILSSLSCFHVHFCLVFVLENCFEVFLTMLSQCSYSIFQQMHHCRSETLNEKEEGVNHTVHTGKSQKVNFYPDLRNFQTIYFVISSIFTSFLHEIHNFCMNFYFLVTGEQKQCKT